MQSITVHLSVFRRVRDKPIILATCLKKHKPSQALLYGISSESIVGLTSALSVSVSLLRRWRCGWCMWWPSVSVWRGSSTSSSFLSRLLSFTCLTVSISWQLRRYGYKNKAPLAEIKPPLKFSFLNVDISCLLCPSHTWSSGNFPFLPLFA